MSVIHNLNWFDAEKLMEDNSANCCVTSPPYWGLRDYGIVGQLGQEETPEEYVENMVKVFRGVKRILKDDGTLWLNLGDSYASSGKNRTKEQAIAKSNLNGGLISQTQILQQPNKIVSGLKPKDLVGIPWMVAFALRADGWYLRQDIIWSKKNCMPESVKDRCTKSHEYIFLLSKSQNYYFNSEAIKEQAIWDLDGNGTLKRKLRQKDTNKSNPEESRSGIRQVSKGGKNYFNFKEVSGTRNKRSVWECPTAQFKEAHFATFNPNLIEPCILAGSPVGGIVLDPFMGSGTTALVSIRNNRGFIGSEINPKYCKIAQKRISKVQIKIVY